MKNSHPFRKDILQILVQYQLCSFSHELINPTDPFPPALTLGVLSILMYFLVFFPDPPQPPEIKGYTEGETIRMGQSVNLECVSYGGNPLATITWFRNGDVVDHR